MKVEIEVEKCIVITENHGGYLAAECIACNASGWLDGEFGYAAFDKKAPGNHLKHKKNCPINKAIIKET